LAASEKNTVRHFTSKRIVGLQDRSDRQLFLAALEDWEDAVTAYRVQLSRIQQALPSGLRRLVQMVSLHDAQVIDISQGQRSRCTIILQPESDPPRQVVLAYSLSASAEIIEDALPEAARSRPLQWLYDELDVAPPGDAGGEAAGAEAGTFLHSILLSNGWEVKVRFRSVTVTRPVSLLRRLGDPSISAAISHSP
jgi:hypothetical protein